MLCSRTRQCCVCIEIVTGDVHRSERSTASSTFPDPPHASRSRDICPRARIHGNPHTTRYYRRPLAELD